jgi:hypothetical protein
MTDAPETPGPEERRLATLFAELQQEELVPAAGFEESVVKTARWQRAVNGMLNVAFSLGGAFADAVSIILGRKPPAR